MIILWAVFGWALAGALLLALWASGNTVVPRPKGLESMFMLKKKSLRIWVVVPVALWTLFAAILAFWLSVGEGGFTWWERSAWFSGESSAIKSAAETRIEEIRNLIGAVAVVAGSFAGAVTIGIVLRRSAQQEEQLVIDRNRLSIESLARSGEALGSEKMATRLSAVFALESIAVSDATIEKVYLKQGMEILAAFVRQRSIERYSQAQVPTPEEERRSGLQPDGSLVLPEKPGLLDADLQAAVTVLIRAFPFEHRPELTDRGGVDLRNARLPRLQLSDGSDLRKFNFDGAEMRYCHALSANCQGANFAFVNASHANFSGSDFSDARLVGATFIGAVFKDIVRKDIRPTRFHRANLAATDFARVHAQDCDFRGASFHFCDISGAVLTGAKLDSPENSKSKVHWDPQQPPIWPSECKLWANKPPKPGTIMRV